MNLAFILDAVYQGIIRGLIGLFLPFGPDLNLRWFPPLMHYSFALIIGLISWAVFRTRLGVLCKAIYLTVPTAVLFATIDLSLYRWPVASYSLGGLAGLGMLYYFYRTKQPWLYSYAVILVGLAIAIFTLSGGEI